MPDSTTDVRPAADGSSARPSPSSEPGQKARRNRRSDYVAQACMNCRDRKVKCSGAPICDACERLGETCTFTLAKRKRGNSSRTAGQHHSLDHANAIYGSSAPDHVFDRMVDLNQRLNQLEQTYSEIHSTLSVGATDSSTTGDAIASAEAPEQPASFEANSHDVVQSQDHQVVNDVVTQATEPDAAPPAPTMSNPPQPRNSIASNNAFGAPNEHLPTPIINIAANSWSAQPRPSDAGPCHPPKSDHSSAELFSSEMFHEVRLNNGAKFRRSFDLYFEFLNPLHPIINENAFYQCFDDLVFEESRYLSESDVPQFLILVHLLYAEVTLLHSMCSDSAPLPGWREFTYANEILTRILPTTRPSVMIVVCLILSTRYLLEIGDHGRAYDTMSTALRIAVQVGLHDQSTWKLKCSDFEVIMRQRVFWCLLILDQAISQSCGLSYRLRPNEYHVELPRAIDDKCLFPNRKLPQENFEASFAPYLNALIAWASLAKRAWDEALCVTKKKIQNFAAITALDSDLAKFLEQLPSFSRADTGNRKLIGLERTELVLHRQRILFRVRVNTQRLLIHMESLKKPGMPALLAEKVVAIAQDSVDTISAPNHLHRQTHDRYMSTVCLAGVFSPLSSIVLATHVTATVQGNAFTVMQQAHEMLKEISKGFRLASTMLQKSQSTIDMVTSVAVPHLMSADPSTHRYSMSRNESNGDLEMVSVGDVAASDVANKHHVVTNNCAPHGQAGMLVSHFPTPAPDSDLLAPADGHDFDAEWIVTPW